MNNIYRLVAEIAVLSRNRPSFAFYLEQLRPLNGSHFDIHVSAYEVKYITESRLN
jgi:hypothetical protein